MKLNPLTFVTYSALIVGMLTPVGLTVYFTRQEVIRFEEEQSLFYAADVVARSEAIVDQIDIGIKSLVAAQSGDPCSASSQTLMKQIDVSSSYIQTIGYVVGNRILCSSMGAEIGGLEIGPVDMVRPTGVRLRLNVEFAFAKGVKFLAVERDGFVAIIHKDLPIDTTTSISDVSLATVTTPEPRIMAARGVIDPRWLNAVSDVSRTFIADNHIVAIVASKRYLIGAICAIPIAELNKRIYKISLFTVPIGLLAGVLLAWAIFQLAKRRTSMSASIKVGLKRKEFFLEYQPVVELATGKWVGAEALIRWRRMKGEIVRPDIFIPVAEENGLIQRLSQYVARQIVTDSGDLFRQFPDFHIAINLSATDMQDQATVLMLRELAAATGASRGNLIVEATERSFTNHVLAIPVITQLRNEGFPVAIDDFGTGYSSLSSLERIKFDFLKIDKSFVDTLDTDAATSEVILLIIEMAKTLKIEMIAEGVETEQQAQLLRKLGVRYAQGWHFAKSLPIEDLLLGLHAASAPEHAA